MVSVEYLLELIFNFFKWNFFMIIESEDVNEGILKEWEILYKVFFEMKQDLIDLKDLVFEIIWDNNLQVFDVLFI